MTPEDFLPPDAPQEVFSIARDYVRSYHNEPHRIIAAMAIEIYVLGKSVSHGYTRAVPEK